MTVSKQFKTFYIEPYQNAALEKLSAKTGKSQGELLRIAIEMLCEKNGVSVDRPPEPKLKVK